MRLDELQTDLRALTGWRARTRLLAGHLFPPPAYMRATCAPSNRMPLPGLYVWRLIRGAARWPRAGGQ